MDKSEKTQATKPKLLKKFDDLNEAFTYPRLRISNVFQELCHQVDLKFAKKQQTESNPEVRSKIDENWNQMIQKIKDYEDACLKKQSTNTFDNVFSNEISASIEIIKQKVEHYNKLKDRALYSGIDDLIYDTLNRIDQVLFLNKTMFFLPKDYFDYLNKQFNYYDHNSKIAYFTSPHEYKDIFCKMDTKTTVGKLVIISNAYCGHNATKLITK